MHAKTTVGNNIKRKLADTYARQIQFPFERTLTIMSPIFPQRFQALYYTILRELILIVVRERGGKGRNKVRHVFSCTVRTVGTEINATIKWRTKGYSEIY